MGKQILKNWSPRRIISFLKKNGFTEVKLRKGDHCGLFNSETKAYTEVDQGRDSFTRREMLGFISQTLIEEKHWLLEKKIQK